MYSLNRCASFIKLFMISKLISVQFNATIGHILAMRAVNTKYPSLEKI